MKTNTEAGLLNGAGAPDFRHACKNLVPVAFMLGVHNVHTEKTETQASTNGNMACNGPRFHKNSKILDTKNAALQHVAKKISKGTELESKSILQEYTQKCKLPLPTYETVMFGESHSPSFQASVEVAGTRYNGVLCKRKKLAEMEAAKTAVFALCSSQDKSTSNINLYHRRRCKRNTELLRLMFQTQKRSKSWLMEMMLKRVMLR